MLQLHRHRPVMLHRELVSARSCLPCELGRSCRLIQEAVVKLHLAEGFVGPPTPLDVTKVILMAVIPPLLQYFGHTMR